MTKLERLLLLWFLGLGSVAAVFSFFCDKTLISPGIEVYFCALTCLAFLGLLGFEGRELRKGASIGFRESLPWLILFTCAFIYRLKFVQQDSFWNDEDYQIGTAIRFFPVDAGTGNHQPPLEFALNNLLVAKLGLNEAVSRLSAIFFGAAGTATFALLSQRIARSWLVGVAAGLVYTFHGIVAHYAWEARPISIGLAGGILVLSSVQSFLRGGPGILTARNWVYGFCASLFTLLVLGLQPAFFLLALSVVVGAWVRKPGSARLWLISQYVSAVLLFLPIQIHIFNFAPPRFEKLRAFSLSGWLGELRGPNFQPLWEIYIRPVVPALILASLVWLVVQAPWPRSAPRRPGESDPREKSSMEEAGFFLITAAAFLVLLVPFFVAYVSWPLQTYYVAMAWPLLLLAVVEQITAANLRMRRETGGGGRSAAAVLILALAASFVDQRAAGGYRRTIWAKSDFRALYDRVRQETAGRDLALFGVCFGPPECFCTPWLVGGKVYLEGEKRLGPGHVDYPALNTFDWFKGFFASPREPEEIAIVVEQCFGDRGVENGDLLRELPRFFPGDRFDRIGDLSVVFMNGAGASKRRELVADFEAIAGFLKDHGRSRWSLLPLLAVGNAYAGDPNRAKEYVREAEGTDLSQISGHYARDIERFQQLDGVLRRLAPR